MFWNPNVLPALAGGVLLYFVGVRLARAIRRPGVRGAVGLLAAVLCLPGLSFILYYAHLMREAWWYIEFRSVPGIEVLSACWGLFFGLLATWLTPVRWPFFRRVIPSLARVCTLLLIAVPFLKPILYPAERYERLQDRWDGVVCCQTTGSTCGPASLATIFRYFGARTTEREIARDCYSSASGTELWYLLRYARNHGLRVRYLRPASFAEVPVPALVGVTLGDPRAARAGHFVTLIGTHGDTFTIGDPLTGANTVRADDLPSSYGRLRDAVAFSRAR